MRKLLYKHKEKILYLIFGGCTTLINMAAYYTLYEKLGIGNIPSNIAAWVISILFAFVTNKIWVFDCRSTDIKILVYEAVSFFECRLATGGIDLAIMFICVDLLSWNGLLIKIVSNVIVIVLNYILSKFIIFKHAAGSDSGSWNICRHIKTK